MDYPKYKKVLWRLVRFLGDTLAGVLTTEVLLRAFSYEPTEAIKYTGAVALGAVFSAVAKYFRERADSYEALSHKLPL